MNPQSARTSTAVFAGVIAIVLTIMSTLAVRQGVPSVEHDAIVHTPTAVPPAPKSAESHGLIASDQRHFAGAVDIGGRKLYLSCVGVGNPAVIFDARMFIPSADFMPIGAELARSTRVCVYDRPNAPGGGSDPVTSPRTSQDIANDLHKLLTAAGLTPPWILVGHAFGGMNMTLFAAQHLNDVAGLVLMDPLPPGTFEEWQFMLLTGCFEGDRVEMEHRLDELARGRMYGIAEEIDMRASTDQLNAIDTVAALPVVLFAAKHPLEPWMGSSDSNFYTRMETIWKHGRMFYEQVAPNLRVIDVDDRHPLHQSASEEAIRAEVLKMVADVRGGAPRPPAHLEGRRLATPSPISRDRSPLANCATVQISSADVL